ncbi:MAG TPA: glycosyltransferase family 2 protein, partial [Candidatus Limnocylindria bacterium]|nr:glycosyltransferase family 2 protein [Candidatus Limnocylindria bacterium]
MITPLAVQTTSRDEIRNILLSSPPGTPFFSIIIPNWNGRNLLEECLESVFAQAFRDFETIVVDNGSTDGSVAFLEENYKNRIRLIPLKENQGFAGGNNRGIEKARGKWVVFFNNDAVADVNWLRELFEAASRHPDVEIFACKVLNYYRRNEIDTVGHLLYPDGIARGRGRLEEDAGQYDREEEVFFPSGCAAAFRKDLLDIIGGFDESFFAYGDDTDLGLRARLFGSRCLLVPRAVAYHKYSSTTGNYSVFKAYQVERNRVWVMLKYFPLRWILVSPAYTILRMTHHLIAALRGKGASGKFTEQESAWGLFRTVLRAQWDAFARMPEILAERRKSRHLRKIPAGQFTEWLRRYRLTARE